MSMPKDTDGMTALMVASLEGYLTVVDELLATGADVNAENKNGITALIFASTHGHQKVVERLINTGAQ